MDSLKAMIQKVKESLRSGLEIARSKGLPKKILFVFAAIGAAAIVTMLLLKALDYVFAAVTAFIDRHFLGVAAVCTGGSYLICRHNEKKAERTRMQAEVAKANDAQKERFAKGAYSIVGRFIFTEVSNAPNFKELCSCERPIRVDDMGSPDLDAYVRNGIIYLRFALPKICADPLDTGLLKSVIQGLVDQKVRTRGLPPLISVGDNRYLYIDRVEDMRTYAHITFALDFSDQYIQQVAYENAMAEVLGKSSNCETLKDRDYGE